MEDNTNNITAFFFTPFTDIDWGFVKTIFDWRSFVYPMTWRRALTWGLYLSLAVAYFQLEFNFEASENVRQALDENITAVTLLTYGFEPLMILLYMALARYPYFEPGVNNKKMSQRSSRSQTRNKECVLIIPCHLSASTELEAESLRKVLRAALKHFKAEHILLIDNGHEKSAPDNTKEVAHEIDAGIKYKYYPYPNKTVATYVGSLLAKKLFGSRVKYALYIDDDVELPENFRLERNFFDNKKIRGIIYPILAKAATGKESLLIKWQNIEYQLSDLALSAHDATKSAQAAHGACVLLHLDTALKVLARHSSMFKGEDKEIGDRLRNLYDVYGRLKLRVDMSCHFKTNVPESYLGPNGNLYQQRVRSWAEAPFLYFMRLTLLPVLSDWRRKPEALVIVKVDQIYNLVSQLSHVFRYLIIYLEAKNFKLWLMFFSMMAVQALTLLIFNYGKLPPYLRNDFNEVITFPFYKQIDNFLAHLSFWRVLLFSLPTETRHPPILELLEKGVLPPFELGEDLDLEKGEGFLSERESTISEGKHQFPEEKSNKKDTRTSTGLLLYELSKVARSPIKKENEEASLPQQSLTIKIPSPQVSPTKFFSIRTIFPDSNEASPVKSNRRLKSLSPRAKPQSGGKTIP